MAEGVNSSMIYFIYYKNFCKCHNVPPAHNKKNKKNVIIKKTKWREYGERRMLRHFDGNVN
jgi:hypothetical protein